MVRTPVVMLLALGCLGFSGFVITDNLLTRRHGQDEHGEEFEGPQKYQAPRDSASPDGPTERPGIPMPGDPQGGGRGGGRGQFDPVAFFKQRDTDGDGKLSGDEISDRMRERLAEIDSDKDGSVSLEEWQQRIRKRSEGGGGFGQGGRGGGGQADEDGPDKRPKRPQRPPMA